MPVAGLDSVTLTGLKKSSYIELVGWTGLQAHQQKRGKLSAAEEAPQKGSGASPTIPKSGSGACKGPRAAITRPLDLMRP
jgi:hypothetical protein